MRGQMLMPLLLLSGCGSPKVVFENSTTVPERVENGMIVPAAEPEPAKR